MFKPRKDEYRSAELGCCHHDVDLVDDLLKVRVVIFQLLASGDVPKSVQDGHIESKHEGHSLVRAGMMW